MKWRNLLLGVFVIMTIGLPDNANTNRPALTKASVDLNELSARLGARSVMERGGELLWQDSFGQGLAPYETTVDAFGSTIVIDPFSSPSSGYSAKLQTAINANASLSIDKILPFININIVGFELRFSITQAQNYITVSIVYTKNKTAYHASVQYNPNTNKLQYANNLGVFVDLDTLNPAIVGRKYYYYLKFQVDTINNKYGKVFFDGTIYDLTSISLSTTVDNFINNIAAQVSVSGNASSANIINTGDWVITRNEILQ